MDQEHLALQKYQSVYYSFPDENQFALDCLGLSLRYHEKFDYSIHDLAVFLQNQYFERMLRRDQNMYCGAIASCSMSISNVHFH